MEIILKKNVIRWLMNYLEFCLFCLIAPMSSIVNKKCNETRQVFSRSYRYANVLFNQEVGVDKVLIDKQILH